MKPFIQFIFQDGYNISYGCFTKQELEEQQRAHGKIIKVIRR